jgi:hypothetical protein
MASTDEAIMSITSESGGTYAVNFNAQYNIDPTDRTGVANDLAIAANLLMANLIPKLWPLLYQLKHLRLGCNMPLWYYRCEPLIKLNGSWNPYFLNLLLLLVLSKH